MAHSYPSLASPISTMAPTIPYFRSPRDQCAAAVITISSSSGSYQSVTNTLVILSSASSTTSVVVVQDSSTSCGGDEARGGQRSAPRRWHLPSPAPSAVPVRSPTVVTAASLANGSGHAAMTMSRRTTVAPHQCMSPSSVLSVCAPGGVVPAPHSTGGVVPAPHSMSQRTTVAPHQCMSPSSVLSVCAPGGVVPAPHSSGGGGDDDEATSRPKRKYRKWNTDDERKILSTLAELRRDNLGVPPQASVLLKKICDDGGLLRRGVDATELSDKLSKLKKKFMKAAAKAAAGGRRLRKYKYRNQVLYKTSMEAWSDLLPSDVAAALQVQLARATRHRGNDARVRL